MSKGDENSGSELEVQFVEYNKQYELELEGFDALNVKYDTMDQKHLFEQVLICKLYGLLYTLETTGEGEAAVTTLQITNYDKLEYRILYGSGNENKGDINKCIFGIVSDFKAYKTENEALQVAVEVEDPYMFIFAHKSESGSGENVVPQSNILRVHKIIKVPNSHVLNPLKTTWTKGTNGEDDVFAVEQVTGFNACGLFAGTGSNDTNYCIVGFKNENVQGADWHFYLPTYSYCLEGRTENILNLGENYAGKFKVSIPEEPADSAEGD